MVMASPLLETKLFIPTRRRGLVARPRLSERLNRGTEAKLTLISAPAGFGKSCWRIGWKPIRPTGDPRRGFPLNRATTILHCFGRT
jgi:LuxR family transcriptional regulator, maltose regulon positive regulatory protein